MPAFFSNPRNTFEARFLVSFISSIAAKRLPFIGVFSFGKRKKSAGTKSGEYVDWGMITILFLVKTQAQASMCELVR